MGLAGFSVRHSVAFLRFYLPPLVLCALAANVLFIVPRAGLRRAGFYRFVWHAPLFNLALYVVLLGSVVFLGDLVWP